MGRIGDGMDGAYAMTGQAEQPGSDKKRTEGWPLVYVVLVNWNAGAHTLKCLSSLEHNSYPNYKTVVVDNASSDGSPDTIAAAYPNVTLLRLPYNAGFTGANNTAFTYALGHNAQFVYLLNTDTWVAPDFLTRAVETALVDVRIGIVGSKVLHGDQPDTLQFVGAHIDVRRGYNGRPIGYNQLDRGQCDDVRDVDWVTGGAMMVSQACLEATGGFDERFFAFHEDVDLSLQARTYGFHVVMAPNSRIWHVGGGSLQGSVSATHMYYSVRNALLLGQKHGPTADPVSDFVRIGCIVGAHVVQVLLSGPTRKAVRGIMDGLRDYYRGTTGPRPLRLVALQHIASDAAEHG